MRVNVGYREYTDEQFDYNWRAREVDDPNQDSIQFFQ
jgi:hypothetical protein